MKCVKCHGKKGIPEEGKKTCEPCLEYQRIQMQQHYLRKKTGTVGPIGRPRLEDINNAAQSPIASIRNEFTKPLPKDPITTPIINPRLFAHGAVVLEEFMPSKNAEPLLQLLLERLFQVNQGLPIEKVTPEASEPAPDA